MPGVKIVRLVGELREAVISAVSKAPKNIGFGPTHGILIDRAAYLADLEMRLAMDDQSLPDIPPSLDADIFVVPEEIAKQAILSLILAGGVFFVFGGAVNLKYRPEGKKKYSGAQYSDSEIFRLSYPMQYALTHENQNWKIVRPVRLRIITAQLDRYFRGGVWWDDRLSMALAYYWGALCTRFPHQGYLGLCISLEALLSPGSMEITHNLAERAAILTESTCENREWVYNEVKAAYKVRSKLVHGSVRIKKGTKISQATLIVSPKYSNVPQPEVARLHNLTISVLKAVLRNREFLDIIQRKATETAVDKDVTRYFLKHLFA